MATTGAWAQTTAPAAATQPSGAEAGPESASIAITRPGTFEIHVQGADLRGVLQLLSTQGKRNIIATKDVRGTVTADLYGVTFDQALKAILASSGFDYIEEDGFIYVYTAKQKAAVIAAKKQPEVRVFYLSYLRAADAQTLIAPVLSEGGTVAVTPAATVGITPDKTGAGGDSHATGEVLVVRDFPDELKKVEKLLKELDVKPDQVLIEATILSAELKEHNKLGVNLSMLAGSDFQDLGVTASSSGAPSFTPGPITEDNLTAVTFRTDFTPVSGGMTFGIFGSDIAMLISAMESVTDVTVLANPKLLVVNKQRGEVMIGRRDGYLTTTVTETTATQTVEFLETGTRLVVRPFIGRDGYIRMEVHPEDSDGSVENDLPSETTTEVTSNVLVRDGHTIVIGGLFRENTNTGRFQVPLVGNIPYVGALFRTVGDGTERDEVIILITPHIMNQPKAEAVSEQAKDDIERMRIGQRKGLRWWACERLAQNHLRWAKQAVRNGKEAEALWNLDMALSMKCRMIEAIRLREQITQKAYWSDAARHSAVKYIIQRMIMHELGKPVEPIIPPDKPRNTQGVDPAVRKALGIEPRVEKPLPAPTVVPGADKPKAKGGPGAAKIEPKPEAGPGAAEAAPKAS